jgi:GTP-binding protein
MHSEFVSSTVDLARLPQNDKPHIAMLGRSNVGKSSLINSLTQRKDLARVSGAPGRTQTMNLYAIDNRYYLMDLPGYGYAKVSQEQRVVFADMLGDYLTKVAQLKLALLIIDARLGPTEYDQEMVDYLRSLDIPFVIIVNKIDKLKQAEAASLLKSLGEYYPDIQLIPHSNIEKGKREVILRAIEEAITLE